MGFLGLIFILWLYFLPGITASKRHHPQLQSIAVVNLFLGWTLVGWVAAMAWAVNNPQSYRPTR